MLPQGASTFSLFLVSGSTLTKSPPHMVSQVRDLGRPGLASQVCDMRLDPELGVAVCSSCPELLRDFGTGQLHFIPHLAPRVTACPRPSRASALLLDQPLDSQARLTQHLGPGPSLCLKPSPRGS